MDSDSVSMQKLNKHMRDCLNALCDIEMDMNRVDAYSAPLEKNTKIQKNSIICCFMFTFFCILISVNNVYSSYSCPFCKAKGRSSLNIPCLK